MTSSQAKVRIVVVVASLLTLGAVTGVTADRATQMYGGPAAMLAGLHARAHHDPLGMIESRIDLRPEQRQRISTILASRQPEVDAAGEEAHARMMAAAGGVISDIAAEL